MISGNVNLITQFAAQSCTLYLYRRQYCRAPTKIRYRAEKRYTSADCSSTGAYQWCSHLANASEAAPASLTFRTAMLTDSGFDFKHVVSYWWSLTTISLKCTVVEPGNGTDRQTDRRTDGRIAASLNAAPTVGGVVIKFGSARSSNTACLD